MNIEEIRKGAPILSWYQKVIGYRIEDNEVFYLIACVGVDGKLSFGLEFGQYDWISIDTNKPL